MIGRGAVKALVEAGMNVVMVSHSVKVGEEIAKSLKGTGGQCVALSNENGDSSVFGYVAERFGSIDVVICNSGKLEAVKPIEEITREELSQKVMHQVAGAFDVVQKAIPYLEKSSAGRVIFMASAGAQDGFQGENFCDSVARGAVISMTYCFARVLANRGITVNCIARSGIVNDNAPHDPSNYDTESVRDLIPVGYIGTNDEFGAAVAYLASEEAGFLTGQVLNLSGGLHIG